MLKYSNYCSTRIKHHNMGVSEKIINKKGMTSIIPTKDYPINIQGGDPNLTALKLNNKESHPVSCIDYQYKILKDKVNLGSNHNILLCRLD